MAKIRVYEAARKLNIETKALMRLLDERGMKVKSPISFLTQEEFNGLLTALTQASPPEEGKGTVVEFPEKAAPRLSIVPPTGGVEPAQTGDEAAAPEEEETPVTSGQKPAPAPAATARPEPAAPRGSSILSYFALGLAAAALLAVFALNSSISKNTESVGQALNVTQTLQEELAAANDGLRINQDLIFENRDTIDGVNAKLNDFSRARIRADLKKQAAALEELAPTVSGGLSRSVIDISRGLNSLASAF